MNVPEIVADEDAAGRRLDQFLTAQLPDTSRARVQELILQDLVRVNGAPAKASLRLRGGERIEVLGAPQRLPLRATPEDIPLDVVYEDDDLAIVNKPAGMMVHAGAGSTADARNRGTLVNALLHRFRALSGHSGELRPGIVHRLDKATSGLLVVAKNDAAHRKLAQQFARREVHKTYIALVHGWPRQESGSVSAPISRDRVRRTRMTTRRREGREALTHFHVQRKIESPYGRFALLEVKIETGRTHQIRVHLASLGHPVVGDVLYGAPREMAAQSGKAGAPGRARSRSTSPAQTETAPPMSLARNFLHAAALELRQPTTGAPLAFATPLPNDLGDFLRRLEFVQL